MKAKKRLNLSIPLWWPSGPGWRRLARWLLPSPGNALFTLLVVGGLLWATSAGALPFRAPMLTGDSTTTISYQGRLADSGGDPVTTSGVGMQFRLYNTDTGGSSLWEESHTAVPVEDGLFHVLLGSTNPIPVSLLANNSTLWLGITVGSDSEMTPREQIASVPYAMVASTVRDGAVDRMKFASMTGIVWKTPPATFYEILPWSPSENAVWDISEYLQLAGVPSDAEMILLGWRPSLISDSSGFVLLDGNSQVLGSVGQGTNLPTMQYSPPGLEYGTPIPVPGATRKIEYEVVGTYNQAPTVGPRRGVIVFGWK